MKLTEVILLSYLLIFFVSSKASGDSAHDSTTAEAVTAEGGDPTEKLTTDKKDTTDATTNKPSAG